MKKILLSIFLAVCMLLTNISVIAEESVDTKYKEAVELLSKLNVIAVTDDNDDFSTQAYVTREEFCVYLVRAFKLETSANSKQVFSDVPAGSGSAQYVNALYEKGIISGYNGAFRPRDVITYNEAIKMLVSLLNYDYASQIGGYPEGYLRIASGLDITKGVYATVNLTKGAAAQLILNAMAAPVMEIVGIKGTDITFKSNGDKSVLTELYDMYEEKGVVLANGQSAMASVTEPLEFDEVMIGDTIYKVGTSNVANLIGHYIKFYYQELDEEEYEIVMILDDSAEELIIQSSQYVSFEDNAYTYVDSNNKTKKVRLDKDFRIMYNFDYPDSGFKPEMMVPDMGRIKLIKSGQGGGYTAVIIEDYTNYVVSSVDVERNVIYTKNRTNIDLNDEAILLDANGKNIEISAIKEWDIISVLTSSDGQKTTVYVSKEKISGKITSVGDAEEPIVKVDYEEYFVDLSVISQLELGKEAVLCLDYNGNVAGVDKTNPDGLRYAYLIEAKIDNYYGENYDERVYVKIFDEDGTQKKYYIADRVTINDVFYKKNPQAVLNVGLSVSVKILKYKLNADGEISTLYVYDGTSDKYIRRLHSGSAYWTLNQRSFGPSVTVESDAPVFVVPEGYAVEDYQIKGISYFKDDSTTNVDVYTMGDNVYGEVIIRKQAGGAGYKDPIAIVKSVVYILDEYGDVCTKVQLLYNGAEQEFVLAKQEILGSVEKGDVVKISLDHQNEIQDILQIYDSSEGKFVQSNPYEPQDGAGYRSEHRCYYGYAYDITDGLMKYCKTLPSGNTAPETENALLSAFRIYVINGPEIRVGSEDDIKAYTTAGNSCSRVIVQTMWWNPADIVVIKG